MPRSVNPGDILVGKGRVPEGTVEDNSLRHPDRDVQPLRAHIHDPSRAHFAVSIAIEDVANNFSSDEVEGALAELAASASASRLNGLLVGGGYTSSGLTLTLDTTTGVLLNGTAQDFSAASVALVNNATQFVYIDVSTATLVTSPTAPTMASEDILLWEITTLAGVVDSDRDGRWFVFNLDRKPSLTIRSEGTAFNQTSEANFVSLEAALLYLEQYGGSAMETSRILVRGSHTITSTVSLPQNGIIFEGDGSGVFVDGTGGGDLFNLGTRNQTQFKNLLFQCNDPASRAIVSASSPDGLVVENCIFSAVGDRWASAIAITGAASTSGYHRIQDSRFECYTAIEIARPLDCVIEDCTFLGSAATGALVGVNLSTGGTGAGEGRSIVRGCRLEDFATGIRDQGENGTITDCVLVNMGVLALRSAAEGATLRNVSITMDATDGISGILAIGDRANIEGCRVVNPRTVWSGVTPIGIDLDGSPDSIVAGCHVEGFLDDNTFAGFGVRGTGVARLKISDTHIRNVLTGISLTDSASVNVQISNCAIEDARFGVLSEGNYTFVTDTQITLSTVDDDRGGESGILFNDAQSKAADCRIENSRRWLVGPTGQIPIGVGFSGLADGGSLDNCVIDGFYNEADLTGAGVLLSVGASSIRVVGSSIAGYRGIEVAHACRNAQIQGNRVNGTIDGISVNRAATGNAANESLQISGNFVSNVSGSTAGIYVNGYTEVVITDNVVNGSGSTATGIHLVGSDAANLRVTNYTISDNTVAEMAGDAILVEDFVRDGTISGNTIDNTLGDNTNVTANGIHLAPGTSGVRDCQVEGNGIINSIRGVYIEGTTTLEASQVICSGNRIQYIGRSIAAADTFDGQGSVGIGALFGSELTLNGNFLSNIGILRNADGTTYSPTGANLSSQGILLWASDQATLEGNTINRVTKTGTATARGISIIEETTTGTPTYTQLNVRGNSIDNTSGTLMDDLIYLQVDSASGTTHTVQGCNVSGNTLRRGTNQIHFSLETLAVLRSLNVSGNSLDDADASSIRFSLPEDAAGLWDVGVSENRITADSAATAGIHFTVDGDGPSLLNVALANNTIQDHGVGVLFDYATAADNCVIRRLRVVGNTFNNMNSHGVHLDVKANAGQTIEIQQVAWDNNTIGITGGSAFNLNNNKNGPVYDFSVSGNQISDTTNRAINLGQSGTGLTQGFRICGNTVSAYVLEAIYLSSPLNLPENIQVDGNVLNSSVATSNHITLTWNDGTCQAVSVCHNILGRAAGLPGAVGIRLEGFLSGADEAGCRDVQVSNNYVHMADSIGIELNMEGLIYNTQVNDNTVIIDSTNDNGIRLVSSPSIPTADEYNENISVNGNLVTGGAAGITLDNTARKIRNVQICGNTLQNNATYGVRFTQEDAVSGSLPAVQNVSIDRNSIEGADDGGIWFDLGLFGSTGSDDMEGLTARGNNISNTGVAAFGVRLDTAGATRNVQLSGNVFTNCYPTSINDTPGTIDLRIGSRTENVTVQGNTFQGCGAVAINCEDVTSLSIPRLIGLHIVGNTIADQGQAGVYINGTSMSNFEDIEVTDNRFHRVGLDGTDSDQGVYILSPVTVDTERVNVSRNTFIDGAGLAIQMDFEEDVITLTCDDNRVDGSGSGGTSAGIQIRADTLIRSVSVSGNQTTSVIGNAIELFSLGVGASGGLRNYKVCGNVVRNDAGVSMGHGIAVLTAGSSFDSPMYIGTVSDNNVHLGGSGNVGIHIDAGDSGFTTDVQALTVTGNTVNDCGLEGMTVSAAGVLDTVTVSNNSVWNVDRDGIQVLAARGMQAISVVGNSLNRWSRDGIADSPPPLGVLFPPYSGILIQNAETGGVSNGFGVTVANNALRNTLTDEVYGICFRDWPDTADAIAVTGNAVQLNGTTGTRTGFRWDQSLLGTIVQRGVSFVNNIVVGAGAAAAASNASFAPVSSTVSANSSDAIGSVLTTWQNFFGTYYTDPSNTSNGDNAD